MIGKIYDAVTSHEDLNRVNDHQKKIFAAMVADDPSLLEKRPAAYLRRWREALNHMADGSAVLDIGAGWPIMRVWDALFEKRLAYHLVDIDLDQVRACQKELQRRGQSPDQAKHSPNTALPFPSASMDFVFSSHCIEHSTRLSATFSDISRVLKSDGKLYFSVPFGFDTSDEHLLFFGPSEWLRVCELAGFRILGWTIARTYTDAWDLSIFVEKSDVLQAEAIDELESRHVKARRVLLPHDHHSIAYASGDSRAPFTICRGFRLNHPVDCVLLARNPWAAVIELRSHDGRTLTVDLFERADHLAALDVSGMSFPLQVAVIGRNTAAHDDQIGVFGALAPFDRPDSE